MDINNQFNNIYLIFKIQNLLETLIRVRLIYLFNERWYLESGNVWKNNTAFCKSLISNIKYTNKQLTNKDLVEIAKGNLDTFPISVISKLLLFTNYKVINNKKSVLQQNQVINEIFKINLNQQKIFDKIELITSYKFNFNLIFNTLNYKQIIESHYIFLIFYLIQLDDLIDKTKQQQLFSPNVSLPTIPIIVQIHTSLESFKIIINDISSTSTSTYKSIKGINNENEKLALQIKNKGNKEYEKGNSIESYELYSTAIKLNGLSNNLKCILYLNKAISLFNTSQVYTYSGTHKIHLELIECYQLLVQSAIYCPSYYKVHYWFGKISKKWGQYDNAIMFLNLSKFSINLVKNDDSNSFLDKQKKLNEINNLITMINGLKSERIYYEICSDSESDDEICFESLYKKKSRNFKLESINKLKQLGNLVEKEFKDKPINNEFINKYKSVFFSKYNMVLFVLGSPMDIPGVDHSTESVVDLKNKLMTEFQTFIFGISSTSNYHDDINFKIECYSRCVGNKSEFSAPYYWLSKLLHYRENKVDDKTAELCLSLLLHSSFLPLKIKEDNFAIENDTIPLILTELGIVYLEGLYNQDIDIKKSKYYFKLAIKLSDGKDYKKCFDSSLNLTDIQFGGRDPYSQLGTLYNNFMLQIDEKKILPIFLKGAKIGSPYCIINLNNYLEHNGKKVDDTTNEIKSIIFGECNNIPIKWGFHHMQSSSHFYSFNTKYEHDQFFYPIEINEIKLLSESKNQNNQFIKSIYKTHLKIVKFIKLFNHYQQQQNQVVGSVGKLDSNQDLLNKMKIINSLSDAYRDYELFFFIRIPNNIETDIQEMVNDLLKSNKNNINLNICWLGLFRVNNTFDNIHRLDFSQESLALLKRTNNKNQDDWSIIRYFYMIYVRGMRLIEQCLHLSLLDYFQNKEEYLKDYFKNQEEYQNFQFIRMMELINDHKNKSVESIDAFTYHTFSSLFYLSPNIKCLFKQHDYLLPILINNANQYAKRYPKDDSKVAEIYLCISLIKLKLNHDKASILEYYDKGLQYYNSITPVLQFTTIKFKRLLNLLKQQLSFHFNDNFYLN